MPAASTAKLEHLRLRDLLLIERVHTLGSLRQVAESMHLTQPAVSQALQTLEDAFGAQLVVRSSGGAVLTSTGIAVLHRLKALRWEAMAAHAVANRPQHPTLSIGLNPITATRLAPLVLTDFMRLYPDVRIELAEHNSPTLWQRLAEGELDAVVCRMPTAETFEHAAGSVVCDVLGNERMVLVAASSHPVVAQGFGNVRLAGLRWVLPPPESYARLALNEWFHRADIALPVAAITSDSLPTNVRLAAASDLLTVVPESMVTELQKSLDLAVVPVEVAWEGFAYVFARRRASRENPLVEAMRAVFLQYGWPKQGG